MRINRLTSGSTFQALNEQNELVGVIVCKLEPHRGGPMRGYIAMLATREEYRGRGIASKLVRIAVDKLIEKEADEVRYFPLPAYASVHANIICVFRSLWKPK